MAPEMSRTAVKKAGTASGLTPAALSEAIDKAQGSVSAAARALGLAPATLSRRLDALPFAEWPETVLWLRLRSCAKYPALREALIERYQPLARVIAKRVSKTAFWDRAFGFDDCLAAARLGLIRAVDRYDPKRKVRFNTYATFVIRGAIIDALRVSDPERRTVRKMAAARERVEIKLAHKLGHWPNSEEVAEHLDWPPRQLDRSRPREVVRLRRPNRDADHLCPLPPEPVAAPEQAIVDQITADGFTRLTRGLPFIARIVLYSLYVCDHTQAAVATFLCLSPSRCSQLRQQAVEWVREHRTHEDAIESLC